MQLKLIADEVEDPNIGEKREAAYYCKNGCNACPLNVDKVKRLHPKMLATGAKRPLVYILGEAPGADEDGQGEQFVGKSGQLLRSRIPRDYRDQLRFNNVVNCRPDRNKTPEFPEIESCRERIVRDIEESKPRAIFGFGNVPLAWVSGGFSGITVWRGRRMPVKIGNHSCWYYPMLHPAYLVRQGKFTEEERMFRFDLERAFAELSTLPLPVVHSKVDALKGVEILTKVEDVKRALKWASQQPAVGFDYETNCLRPYIEGAKILTVGVGTDERAFAFPVDHPGAPWRKGERDDIVFVLTRFLQQAAARKISHSLAFELEWTGVKLGTDLVRAGKWEDTISQAFVIDERKGGLSLEFLVQQYFGLNVKEISNLDRSALESTPLDPVLRYNALDAKYHFLLWGKQRERILDEGLQVPYNLQLRKVPTVVLSQIKGLPVNQNTVKALEKKYAARVEDLTSKIMSQPIVKEFKSVKGREYNWQSNPDSLYIFWDMLKRDECRVTDKYHDYKEKLSVSEEVLSQINHPLASLLIKARKAERNLSTYIIPLLKNSPSSVIYPDNLVHTVFNTNFARTGRLSSDSPNLQNWPMRDDEAKECRAPIEAPVKCVGVKIDYGQLEARVIAMATKDKRFCKALWENFDVHQDWAVRIATEYPKRVGGRNMLGDKKVMKAFRTDIKNQWTFPLFFGATLESASSYLHIPESILGPLYREFWKEFSGVKEWQIQQLEFYQNNGYVECLTGRRRYGPLSVNKVYNSPIQGTAAEIVMDAMARISETGDMALQPEINIHDDLTWMRVPEEHLEKHVETVLNFILKPNFKWINVPITAEVAIGPNWAEMHEEGTFSSHEWFK